MHCITNFSTPQRRSVANEQIKHLYFIHTSLCSETCLEKLPHFATKIQLYMYSNVAVAVLKKLLSEDKWFLMDVISWA